MRVLNYGLGTNSTALAIEATNRGIVFDIIIAADTGDERRKTYAYAETFDAWLQEHGQPGITWVKWIREDGTFVPISSLSLARGELPSKAYGLAGCQTKWKQQPVDKFLKNDARIQAAWARGEKVERWIGYDAGEPGRAERMFVKDPQPDVWMRDGVRMRKPSEKLLEAHRMLSSDPDELVRSITATAKLPTQAPGWKWRCPLVEWDMGREECLDVIERAALPQPGKSACFMCPSMKKHEILTLAREEPEEMARALAIEDAARASGNLKTVKGLGRSFSWREFLEGQGEACAARETVEEDCGCFDGSE